LVLAAVSAACLAQDYEEYQPQARQSQPTRYNQAQAQEQPKKEEPIAILKQINKHNEDGSYTYGYEGADGSFKIETKTADGEVKGKYGYIDGEGNKKTVEYGANKYGFQPSGEGISVSF
jgi:Insect cuticle protein